MLRGEIWNAAAAATASLVLLLGGVACGQDDIAESRGAQGGAYEEPGGFGEPPPGAESPAAREPGAAPGAEPGAGAAGAGGAEDGGSSPGAPTTP